MLLNVILEMNIKRQGIIEDRLITIEIPNITKVCVYDTYKSCLV